MPVKLCVSKYPWQQLATIKLPLIVRIDERHIKVAPKDVYDIADAQEAERKRLEAAAPKKRRASSLLRAAQN
ncbi:unnamed protein product [Colias eurytheme]|nr:unnamed protein product [Colias eurytheme]